MSECPRCGRHWSCRCSRYDLERGLADAQAYRMGRPDFDREDAYERKIQERRDEEWRREEEQRHEEEQRAAAARRRREEEEWQQAQYWEEERQREEENRAYSEAIEQQLGEMQQRCFEWDDLEAAIGKAVEEAE